MADEKECLSRLIKFLDTFKTEIKLGERWKVYKEDKKVADGYYITLRFNGSSCYSVVDEMKDGRFQLRVMDDSFVIGFRELTKEDQERLQELMEECKKIGES